MKRVTGLGGVFFKCKDPKAQQEWYKKHLSIEPGQNGTMFEWREIDNPDKQGCTVWSTFKEDTKYFAPSEKPFMFNYRVDNLVELIDELRKEGVQVVGEIEVYDFGKFGWIMDPEGNKVELWEPLPK